MKISIFGTFFPTIEKAIQNNLFIRSHALKGTIEFTFACQVLTFTVDKYIVWKNFFSGIDHLLPVLIRNCMFRQYRLFTTRKSCKYLPFMFLLLACNVIFSLNNLNFTCLYSMDLWVEISPSAFFYETYKQIKAYNPSSIILLINVPMIPVNVF